MDERDRRARLQSARLYLILTIGAEAPNWRPPLEAALATRRIGMVQLRDTSGDEARVRRRVDFLKAPCAAHGVLLLLNDNPALAAELDLDGAHVGQEDLAPAAARALLGPRRLLGLSTHDTEEIAAARTAPGGFLGLGPCFATDSKALDRRPKGADLVARCAGAAGDRPVFPIGGITPANAPPLVAAGALRLAVGAGILGAPDPSEAARRLADALHGAASDGSA